MRTPSLVLTGMLVGLVPGLAFADWPCKTKTNLPVCTAAGDQYLPVVASDGVRAVGDAMVRAWEARGIGAQTFHAARPAGGFETD